MGEQFKGEAVTLLTSGEADGWNAGPRSEVTLGDGKGGWRGPAATP